MKRKRRHLTPEFKARIAIGALQGVKTINEIAQANELAPTQVSQWKKELEGRVPEIFTGENHAKSDLALKEK
ncbi:MAG: transposase [Verrucomicrobiaceae bacterium]|nr:transposase [Verrucomicrobiales bacterium]MDC0312571.1 transposase [Verrucomicrobiales bacterium]MDF1790027.1 transposase [Verrucomicrobiales bacterium]NCF88120.1 transposase [Verrucomicrobiaceae bacterium]NCF92243.1 transposase [Verrucomicrobiaceae bacterium]